MEPDVGSSSPPLASLTRAGLDESGGSFQLCIIFLAAITVYCSRGEQGWPEILAEILLFSIVSPTGVAPLNRSGFGESTALLQLSQSCLHNLSPPPCSPADQTDCCILTRALMPKNRVCFPSHPKLREGHVAYIIVLAL